MNPVGTAPAARKQALPDFASSDLDCLASHGIRIAVTCQPASPYWAFQRTQTAINLALAGYCFRRLNRRLC